MSSALFVSFRSFSRLLNSGRFVACNNTLKSYRGFRSSCYVSSRLNQSRLTSLNGPRHHSSWLCKVHQSQRSNNEKNDFKFPYYLMLIPTAVKRFFGLESEEDEMDPKSILILNIKRSILAIQRGQIEKAEQLLHISLKMAQDQQNEEGITYVYDIMANLAFDNDKYDKAEKLFLALLQRCLASGMQQDDNKFIHINLKLAKVYQYSKRPEKSELGYQYCLDSLEKKMKSTKDEDTVLLWCLAQDWYGRFLLEKGDNKKALSYLNKAHDTLVEFGGEDHPQVVLLLNDLGIAHSMLDNESAALAYFEKAIKLGKELDDPLVPNIMVNLGLLYLRKVNTEEASNWCKKGLEAAVRLSDTVSEKEAQQCLSDIMQAMKAR